VLTSILGLFNFKEFQRYYRQRKTDFGLALTALVGVVASDVMTGLILAVLLSLVMLLYRASRPYIALLGKRASGEYGDMGRHADAQSVPGLVILRLDAPLYFFNANVARTQILEQRGVEPPPQAILLDLGASADLDIGTSDTLRDLTSDLRQANIDLLFAQVRGSVRQRMRVTGLFDHIGEDRIFLSVDAAVQSFLSRPVAAPSPPAPNGTESSPPTGAAEHTA
jgi:sulfate permease, SulP family